MNRYTTVLLIFMLPMAAFGQRYYTKQYRVEKGLPSDIIKGCAQDSLGYFWIATDEGLVNYDGINFTSYRKAMHGNYAKGFFTTRSGRLLAYGDLDFIEIQNSGDTVRFKSVCPVSRIANDSSLSYPKLIFEDIRSDLWISESQSVVKLYNNSLTRYEFDIANRTPQFLRAFSFFEDQKHNLFITSFQGNVFRYNTQTDAFESVDKKLPFGVECISAVNNQLIIGSRDGLSQALLPDEGGFATPESILKIPFVSFVSPLHNGKYFIATRGSKHFIADIKTHTFKAVPNAINNINHVYQSKENDILISGNEGWIIMHENLFQGVSESITDFIESITEDVTLGIIYYATSRTLYSFNPSTRQNKIELDLPTGYFQSLVFTRDGIWIANAFKVFLFSDGRIKKEFDFGYTGRFITEILDDSNGNIWLTIPGSTDAYRIDAHYDLKRFSVPLGNDGVINMIREGEEGMYIASAGKSSYLFFKSTTDSVFHNISIPVSVEIQGDFNVTDLVINKKRIWLASSEGLLKLENDQLRQVDLGDTFTKLPIKSIHVYANDKLLLANAFGMILYDRNTGAYDLFNESSGLLSNTITANGLFVSQRKRIYIGTAIGLCYSSDPLTVLHKTPAPQFIQLDVNGKKIALHAGCELGYGSFVSIHISSITFPNEVTFQYRLAPEKQWKVTAGSVLNFSSLSAGDHTLEVRAKKIGPYSWSDSSLMMFKIAPPFWHRWWFYLVCIIAISAVVALTIVIANARIKKRNKELQILVDERTKALRLSNEELINLDLEKNNLIGIVAHDLKNPLSQLMGMLSIIRITNAVKEESVEYLAIMEQSISRLNEMVMKILDVDAIESKQLNLTLERLDLAVIFNAVVNRHSNDAKKKNIVIIREIESGIFAHVDKNYAEEVLENLVSNAIKFSPFKRNVFVYLRVVARNVVCEIKDEGPGLSEEDKKKLFGKYQKLTPRPTGNEISTGLGLSIAKRFVEAMNGEIWCESEPGKGTRFFVSFKGDH